MLFDEFPEREAALRQALQDAGCEVVGRASSILSLHKQVGELKPDVIMIDTESPSRDTLEHLCDISRDHPRPIVMFSADQDGDTIKAAVNAGVSAYIVDGLQAERLRPIMDVAIAQFQAYQALRDELAAANTRLSERKLVERAKGILMQQRDCSEDEAYRALRKMAMERNMRLAELARQLVSVAQLLI
jgi:response regulator NasT